MSERYHATIEIGGALTSATRVLLAAALAPFFVDVDREIKKALNARMPLYLENDDANYNRCDVQNAIERLSVYYDFSWSTSDRGNAGVAVFAPDFEKPIRADWQNGEITIPLAVLADNYTVRPEHREAFTVAAFVVPPLSHRPEM